MKLLTLVLTLAFDFTFAVTCDEDELQLARQKYAQCLAPFATAIALKKLDVCQGLEQMAECAVTNFEECGTEEEIQRTISTELRGIVGLYISDGKIEVPECEILKKYKISSMAIDERKLILGRCDGKEFEKWMGRLENCKAQAELAFKVQLLESPENKPRKICDHLQFVLDNCFPELFNCFTDEAQIQNNRRAFKISAIYALKKLFPGFNEDSCFTEATRKEDDQLKINGNESAKVA